MFFIYFFGGKTFKNMLGLCHNIILLPLEIYHYNMYPFYFIKSIYETF